LSPIAAFLGGEIEGLVRFPVPPIPVPRGVLPDRDQGQALWQARIAAPNSRAQSSDGHGEGSTERDTRRRSFHGPWPDVV